MQIEQFLKDCNSCGSCQTTCPFLSRYGNPKEILQEDTERVFECTNCRACTMVCPFGLDPAGAIFQRKTGFLRVGRLSEKVIAANRVVAAFAKRGHRFPFVYYGSGEYVFWPGCGLTSVSPALVRLTQERLAQCLHQEVGLVLDCCFDPCWQMGDVDTVQTMMDDIASRLRQSGVKTIITGCGNCTKVLGLYLEDIKVLHVFEVLPEAEFEPSQFGNDTALHHPCPSFRFETVQHKARALTKVGSSNNLPECCGFGGELHHLNMGLSQGFADRVIGGVNADSPILTYCMGCKQRFQSKGRGAYHILEALRGAKKIEQPPSTFTKYLNRFALATVVKVNLKKVAVFLALIVLIVITAHLRSSGYITIEGIMDLIKGQPVLAPMLFIGLYAIGPSLFIPSLPMTLGAGFIWGPLWGSVFAITGATIGATMPFLLSRYIMAETIKRRFSRERWEALNEKVVRHGWKAVAFARLMPILPFPVLNYVFGLTPIPLFHYVWATFVFMLPACIAYTAFGSSMGELIMKGNVTGLVIGIVIASIAMTVPFVVKRYFMKGS